MKLPRRSFLGASLSVLLATGLARGTGRGVLRWGVVSTGTASWEADVIRRHALSDRFDLDLQTRSLASSEAGKIALQAGAVDVIVSDLIWTARQRADGNPLSFISYSRAVGALEVPPASTIRALSDLAGKTLGIAGGPLDKSWLLLRALSLRELGKDMAELTEPVFGAPQLLSNELEAGRLDAVLTYWNFAARLEAAGVRPLLTVSQILARLGMSGDVPLLGYVFREDWARNRPELVDRFARCCGEAKRILAWSDQEWQRLEPLLRTDDPAVKAKLRDGYRAGIPGPWSAQTQKDAAALFDLLARLGGEQLVGSANALDPAMFWTPTPS